MSDLLAARCQMGMSLIFHIVFAAIGIAMPLIMIIAEGAWLKTGDPVCLQLAKRWAKGTAILFAVGAVSGTVLSFELGLLLANFMRFAGGIIGMPFSLEGFAFYTEAIFLGIYLYGWQRVNKLAHFLSGVMVVASGALSGIFVVIANAWMNTPSGFVLKNGQVLNVDPIQAMLNPNAFAQTGHMIIAAYAATGFAVAGIHALALLKDRDNLFHKRAIQISLVVGVTAALVQPLSGDLMARTIAANQPLKLAAFESLFETQAHAPLLIGGIPDEKERKNRFGIEIPYVLSLLAFHDPNATVKGLNSFPQSDWPDIAPVHMAFQLMVIGAGVMGLMSAWWLWIVVRRESFSNWFLKALVLSSPFGFIALEAGWLVTELGRQPWIIYGLMRTSAAVTPMPGLIVTFTTFTLLYLFLATIVIWLLIRQVAASPKVVA